MDGASSDVSICTINEWKMTKTGSGCMDNVTTLINIKAAIKIP
jgi:hypothetical protein